MRKRRAEIDACVHHGTQLHLERVQSRAADAGYKQWDEGMTASLRTHKALRRNALLRCINEGALLDADYDAVDAAAAATLTAREKILQGARLRAAEARVAAMSRGASDPQILQGMAVFIEPGARTADCGVQLDL